MFTNSIFNIINKRYFKNCQTLLCVTNATPQMRHTRNDELTNWPSVWGIFINMVLCIIADIYYGVIMASSKVCTLALSILCFALLIESSKWSQKSMWESLVQSWHFIFNFFLHFGPFRLCNQMLPVFVGHKSKMCWLEWFQYQAHGKIQLWYF